MNEKYVIPMLKRLLPLLVGIIMITFTSRAQSVSWNDRIMLPIGVVEEKLDNGLSYILVENEGGRLWRN